MPEKKPYCSSSSFLLVRKLHYFLVPGDPVENKCYYPVNTIIEQASFVYKACKKISRKYFIKYSTVLLRLYPVAGSYCLVSVGSSAADTICSSGISTSDNPSV
jgi:hypothetical protein